MERFLTQKAARDWWLKNCIPKGYSEPRPCSFRLVEGHKNFSVTFSPHPYLFTRSKPIAKIVTIPAKRKLLVTTNKRDSRWLAEMTSCVT